MGLPSLGPLFLIHPTLLSTPKSPIGSILLQHFRWNTDLLIEKYMDSPASVLRAAGEPQNINIDTLDYNARPNKRARLDTPTEFMCAICCDTDAENSLSLRCTHAFCEPCWKTYITSKIKEEGQCFFHCMQDGCVTALDGPTIHRLTEADIYDR